MDSKKGDILWYTKVRWLSRSRIFKRVTSIEKLNYFWKFEDKAFLQFCHQEWTCSFAFCADIGQLMNQMNINLEGSNHLLSEMFKKVTAFERNLRVQELITAIKQYDRPTSHF
jgi:hypothetical protein